MSWSDSCAWFRAAATAFALVAAGAGAAGCTAGPLYQASALAPQATAASAPLALRGRIAVAAAGARTDQIVRNALLFRLNGGQVVTDPAYEVRYQAVGVEDVAIVQPGTGRPTSGLYRLTVTYQLVRLSDAKVVSTGTRFAVAPFNRTVQQFASQRALLDARQQAGEAVAAQVEIAVAAALAAAG